MSVEIVLNPDLPREKREAIEASYRPLPYGWLFPCGVIVVVMLWSLTIVSGNPNLIGFGSAITAVLLYAIGRCAWLSGYWQRNVVGFVRWHYLRDGKFCTAIAERWTAYARLDRSMGAVIITSPLGGWLHCSRVITCNRDGMVKDLSYDLTVSRPVGGSLWLRWRGNRIEVTLDEAQEILQGCKDTRTYNFARYLVEELWRTTAGQRTAAQRLERATTVLRETVSRLDATKRFIKSTQAQEIREWLEGELGKLCPAAAPASAAPVPTSCAS